MSQMQEAPAARQFALANGDGERLWFLNSEMTIKATAASTGGDLFLMETRLPAGFSPPLHVHHDEHEAFYVLEGELEIACGSERYSAAAGAFAFLPSGIAHTFRVVGGLARPHDRRAGRRRGLLPRRRAARGRARDAAAVRGRHRRAQAGCRALQHRIRRAAPRPVVTLYAPHGRCAAGLRMRKARDRGPFVDRGRGFESPLGRRRRSDSDADGSDGRHGLQDHVGHGLRLRDHDHVGALDFRDLGAGPLRHRAGQVGAERLVAGRDDGPRRAVPPRRRARGLARTRARRWAAG